MSKRCAKKVTVATRRWPLASSAGRVRVLVLVVAMLFSLCGARAVQVQVLDPEGIAAQAADQMTRTAEIPALRGRITDRNGQVLAFTEDTVDVVADPLQIAQNGKAIEAMRDTDRAKAAQAPRDIAQLAQQFLGADPAAAETQLRRTDTHFVYVAKQVPAASYLAMAKAMSEKSLIGVASRANPRRSYPMGTVASNVVGFVNSEGKGVSGVEQSRQKDLQGVPGKETYQIAPYGRIPLGTQVVQPATDGKSYQLTIDADLQWQVEQLIATKVKETPNLEYGIGLAMEVKTGRILALANAPSFNSNEPGKADPNDLWNRAITNAYDPGSTMKVLSLAAMLDAGVTTPDSYTKIPAEIRSGDDPVRDAFSHGDIELNTRGILVRSSNIGTLLLARQLGKESYAQYLKEFRLGQKTKIGLPGEASGWIPGPTMPGYTLDHVSFGSGLTVTPVQMAAAVAGVANNGVYNTPTLIQSTTDAGGKVTQLPQGESHRVISEQASLQMREMMEQMVIHYSDALYVPGYRTSAKTGTAQIFNTKTKRYDKLVTSIIGFAPTEDPQVLVYVVFGTKDRRSSGIGTAGPAYRQLMSLALPHYGIRQSATEVTTELPMEKGQPPKKK